MIAIFTDQHLCEQRRRCQSAGDQPFRCRRLRDLVADAASVFRAGDARYGQLRGHPIQHLADASADGEERTTTTAADITSDVEQKRRRWGCGYREPQPTGMPVIVVEARHMQVSLSTIRSKPTKTMRAGLHR